MQFKKSHIPLVPRTANYSCSLTNRSLRKKAISTQTDKCLSPFENWFNSNEFLKDEFTFNEETTKTYCMALEYINSFHCYMNKKLSEKFGECGDTKPEGSNFFKLPDIPNYATVFHMLLEKTKGTTIVGNNNILCKKKTDNVKPELEAKKYTTKESVIEFVPEIKKLPEYKILEQSGALEEIKVTIQKVHTVVNHLDYDSTSSASKTISDDISPFSSNKSSNSHTTPSEEYTNLEKYKTDSENVACKDKNFVEDSLNSQDINKGDKTTEKIKDDTSSPLEQTTETQTDTQSLIGNVTNEILDEERRNMMEIIKNRVQEEISIYLDKSIVPKTEQPPRLMKSHFNVINIPPQINLLDYAQKKLERQLTTESRPMTTTGNLDAPPRLFNNICVKKSLNIRPSTPKKVRNMFRKFSQDKFPNLETTSNGGMMTGDCVESDDDSVILDDDEFEKINGYVNEQNDKKQKITNSVYNLSAGGEKSSPLKLTVRDMTTVNEKMLNTIGLFTERGDIRPGVIDILEEQKKAKAKDTRNKQFRSRRQWDLQIHLNPKQGITSSLTSISTDNKSFISLSSSDLRSDYLTVKNVSQVNYNG